MPNILVDGYILTTQFPTGASSQTFYNVLCYWMMESAPNGQSIHSQSVPDNGHQNVLHKMAPFLFGNLTNELNLTIYGSDKRYSVFLRENTTQITL